MFNNRRNFLKLAALSPTAFLFPELCKDTSATASNRVFAGVNDHTFDSFLLMNNNYLAYETSRLVARRPGQKKLNPLYIFGPQGMGKTHLMNAVGAYFKNQNPKAMILRISGERFVNECIENIRTGTLEHFRHKFQMYEMLLVDDIEVLSHGEIVQREFLQVMKYFGENNKQLVITGDLAPAMVKGFHDKMRSYMEGGALVEVQPMTFQQRITLARFFAKQMEMKIDERSLQLIAKASRQSARFLQSALNQIRIRSEVLKVPISRSLVEKTIGHMARLS